MYRKIHELYEPSLVNKLISLEASIIQDLETLQKKLRKVDCNDETESQFLREQITAKRKEYKELFVNFALSYSNSHIGTDLLYKNRENINKDVLIDVYENLEPVYQNSEFGTALNIYVNKELIEVGKPYIDIQANTLDGNKFRLSELIGNNILLIFWSSGCKAARSLNQYLSSNYPKINSNVKIISFSTGSDKGTWEKASQEDKICWHNISNLEGPRGKVKTLYNVLAIPTLFHINKKGIVTIKEKGFREGLIDFINHLEKNDR